MTNVIGDVRVKHQECDEKGQPVYDMNVPFARFTAPLSPWAGLLFSC